MMKKRKHVDSNANLLHHHKNSIMKKRNTREKRHRRRSCPEDRKNTIWRDICECTLNRDMRKDRNKLRSGWFLQNLTLISTTIFT